MLGNHNVEKDKVEDLELQEGCMMLTSDDATRPMLNELHERHLDSWQEHWHYEAHCYLISFKVRHRFGIGWNASLWTTLEATSEPRSLTIDRYAFVRCTTDTAVSWWYIPVASLRGWGGDPSPGWQNPNENLIIFCSWIYKNTGQTISWKGGEGWSGDGSLSDDD